MVVSAGNSENEDPYTQSPIPATALIQAWAADPNGVPNIIVVGASDRMGRAATFSQEGPAVTVYAPGDRVLGAYTAGRSRKLYGTSYGMVLSIPFYHYSTSSCHAP
jgi:hypothetical protein